MMHASVKLITGDEYQKYFDPNNAVQLGDMFTPILQGLREGLITAVVIEPALRPES